MEYIESNFPTRLSVEYRGKLWPIEDILYKWFHCEIVHAASLPVDLDFIEAAEPDQPSFRAGGAPEFRRLVSISRFDQLVASARA